MTASYYPAGLPRRNVGPNHGGATDNPPDHQDGLATIHTYLNRRVERVRHPKEIGRHAVIRCRLRRYLHGTAKGYKAGKHPNKTLCTLPYHGRCLIEWKG